MLRLLHLCLLASVATILWSAPCHPVICDTLPYPQTTTTTTTTTPAPRVQTSVPAAAPCATNTVAYNPCDDNTVGAQTSNYAEYEKLFSQYIHGLEAQGAIKIEEQTASLVLKPNNETRCPPGWTRYKESCYYIQREQKKTMREAEKLCLQMNSTLFVPNTKEEFETIFENAPLDTWTWLGLYKENEEKEPHWHVKEAFDYTKLKWLHNDPYGDAINGWSTKDKCAAHWNPSPKFGKYVYWYPCIYAFHYVCERNSTLINEVERFF